METRVHLAHLGRAAGVVALGVTVSLITSTVVAARAYERRGIAASGEVRSITVKGSVRRPIRADQAVWRVEVSGEAAALPDAYAALEQATGQVHAFLTARGFAEGQMGLSAIDTRTYYQRDAKGMETREIAGQRLSRVFTISTPEVDRVAQAAGSVTELLREGVSVSSAAPEYSFTRLGDLRIELMGEAAADARLRAERIAQAAGSRITEVRSASMGVLQVTQPHSTEVSGYGIYDTSTIDKDVVAVVTLTLGLAAQ
ncbi:MAG: SIMPL domain-containing protein [Phycisphaerales bacterium]|nr:SIMPL domain-containing protein [Phycisphaerales bacterium]